MKNNFRDIIEDTFAAAAFAEAGEHETAMKIAGIRSIAESVAEKIRQVFHVHMSAACFAESGCHDTALQILGTEKRAAKTEQRPTLDEFLRDVGLNHARVRYGMVTV